jgi:NADH:ubiquinone oxidoreductase subunit H
LAILIFTDCTGQKGLNFELIGTGPARTHLWPASLVWAVCILAECKRAPFDLPEAEPELVAGYNVEYGSVGLAMFFMAEYASMAAMGALLLLLLLAAPFHSYSLSTAPFHSYALSAAAITGLFVAFVWTRASLPRYRADQFMRLGWKAFLPLCFAFLGLYASTQPFPLIEGRTAC